MQKFDRNVEFGQNCSKMFLFDSGAGITEVRYWCLLSWV